MISTLIKAVKKITAFFTHKKTAVVITTTVCVQRINGAGDGTRTRDLLITSQLLYQLSYTSIIYGDPEGARTLDLQRDRLAF